MARKFNIEEIINDWKEARQMSRADQCRIGRVMKDLGFKKHRPLIGGTRVNVYTRDYKDAAERMREMGIERLEVKRGTL